jgi:hypothetical protein
VKTCPSCSVEKGFSDYWKNQSCCIECSKWKQKNSWNSRTPKKRLEQHLKYKYGIDVETFLKALETQQGKCAICIRDLPDLFTYENRRRGYAIDHNHDTGEFRGILCLECNTLLGMAGDSPKILKAAIKYLSKNGNYSNMAASKKKKK